MSLYKLLFANNYRTINTFFIAFILCIFIYSAIFSPVKNRYPIPSVHNMLAGENSLSTGLSRGFSSIIRLRFDEALRYNQYSIRIVGFFLLQLLMRISATLFQRYFTARQMVRLGITDTIISASMFIIFFWPFLKEIFIKL